MPTLEWTDPFRVTANAYDEYGTRVAYGPDRSLYVLYVRNTVGSDGLFVRRRKKDGTWLDEYRLDYLPDVDSVLIDPNVNPLFVTGGYPCMEVDADGNLHVTYLQSGYGGTPAFTSIVYRQLQFVDGQDYGDPLDKIVYYQGATITYAVMSRSPLDGTIWLAFTEGGDPFCAYILADDAPGTVLDATSPTTTRSYEPWIWNTGSLGTSGVKSEAGIFADRLGGVHAAFVSDPDEEINYVYRGPGDTMETSSLFREAIQAVDPEPTAGDDRTNITVYARRESDVYVGYRRDLGSGNSQCWHARRKPGASTFSPVRLDDPAVSGAHSQPVVAGTDLPGQALSSHAVTGSSSVGGIYYSYQEDEAWTIAQAAARESVVKPIQDASLVIRRFGRSPFTMGMINPRAAEAAVVWAQRA